MYTVVSYHYLSNTSTLLQCNEGLTDYGWMFFSIELNLKLCLLQDGTDMAATQRAYHPDELKSREDLKIGKIAKLFT